MKAILALLLSVIFFSCSKNNDTTSNTNNPNNTGIVYPDTLTAGWTIDTIPGRGYIQDIFFENNLVGYTCGRGGIHKSIDGGNTWSRISAIDQCYNLAVTPDGKFFGVGGSEFLYFSLNGGASFDSLNLGSGEQLKDVFFTDNNNGFIASIYSLFQTTNGGINWNRVSMTGINFSAPNVSSLFFLNASTGWQVTINQCMHTNGNITNWQPAATSFNSSLQIVSVWATDENTVYVSAKAGSIYKSVDGGINFSLLANFTDEIPPFTDLSFTDANTGYFSCGRKVYKTTDAGVTWQPVVSLGSENIIEIHFTDATHGWAAGVDGSIVVYRP